MGRWSYVCDLGLAQGTCDAYERDDKAPEANKQWGGCPSCKHRVPHGSNTALEWEG